MKKTAIIFLIIIWTIIVFVTGLWKGSKIAYEYARCATFSSEKTEHAQGPCYSAGCKPDSPGGEWTCIPEHVWF